MVAAIWAALWANAISAELSVANTDIARSRFKLGLWMDTESFLLSVYVRHANLTLKYSVDDRGFHICESYDSRPKLRSKI